MRSFANIVRRKKPWITAEVLNLCDKRRELRKKRFKPEGAAKYKEVNNNIKRCMKKAKENSGIVRGEISRGGGGDGVETEARSLIGNLGSDRQPAKMSEYWSNVNMWKCTNHKTGCTVLDFLKFVDQGLRETSQERVAIVNA